MYIAALLGRWFASLTLEQYTDACAVVLSRVQPWFGGSLVPFVDQAEWKWRVAPMEPAHVLPEVRRPQALPARFCCPSQMCLWRHVPVAHGGGCNRARAVFGQGLFEPLLSKTGSKLLKVTIWAFNPNISNACTCTRRGMCRRELQAPRLQGFELYVAL